MILLNTRQIEKTADLVRMSISGKRLIVTCSSSVVHLVYSCSGQYRKIVRQTTKQGPQPLE